MSNGSGRVPVIACVRDAWMFLAANWRLFLPAAGIAAVLSEIGTAAVAIAGGAANQAGLGVAVLVPTMLAGLMFQGAILRKSIRGEFKPPAGLTFGADEARMLGVGLSITLLTIPVFLLLTIMLSATLLRQMAPTPEALEALAADPAAFAEALTTTLGPGGSLALILSAVAIGAILFGLVALANAATIGERKVVVFQAWGWLGGNTLRVFATMVLTVTPVLILTTVVAQLVTSGLIAISGEAIGVVPYLAASVLITFINLLIGVPITALGAILYTGLRPAGFAAR